MVLHCLSAIRVDGRSNQPATIQNGNKPDAPEIVEVEISNAELFGSTSQFLGHPSVWLVRLFPAHGGSPATFAITKASTQKQD